MLTVVRPPLAALAGAVILALARPGAATANTISVDGVNCTLANAIASANTDSIVGGCAPGGSGADIISIPSFTALTLTAELPTITSDIAFQGQPPLGASISGDGTHRLFIVDNGATVSFSNLVLAGGVATGGNATEGGGGGGGLGGAIFISSGHVSTNAVTFTLNTATGGSTSGSPALFGTNNGLGMGGGGGGGMFGAGGFGASSGNGVNGGGGAGGGFGGGGGGGGLNDSVELAGNGGAGGGFAPGGAGAGGASPTSGGPGGVASGGGGGGAGLAAGHASQPGGAGGFGGGGGGGAGQCIFTANCGSAAGSGAAGGFGGGGGAGGAWSGGSAGSGGAGGFGGGGGTNGLGEGGSAVGAGGFGGGSAKTNAGGGGGGGLGGAIFIRSGDLDLQNTAFDQGSATGGVSHNAVGANGLGKGAAIFALNVLVQNNGNNQGMPVQLPVVTGCSNSFTNNAASDSGSVNEDNGDVFGVDRLGLSLQCGDRLFADGFDR
jgi:hypothetical protein